MIHRFAHCQIYCCSAAHKLRLFGVILSIVAVILLPAKASGSDDRVLSPPPIAITSQQPSTSLETYRRNIAILRHLVETRQHQLAGKVAHQFTQSHFYDHEYFTLYLTLLIDQQSWQKAQKLFLIAREFYPDDLHLLRLGIMAYATPQAGRNHCIIAQNLYQNYLQDAVFEDARLAQAMHHYCDFEWRNYLSFSSTIMKVPRLNPAPDQNYITAQEGSFLDQLCDAITSLCPETRRFDVAQVPKEKLVLELGYHNQNQRAISTRTSYGIGLSLFQHFTGFRRSSAVISLLARHKMTKKVTFTGQLKTRFSHLPAYQGLPAHHSHSQHASISVANQMTKFARTVMTFDHNSTDISEPTGLMITSHGTGASFTQFFTPHDRLEFGLNAHWYRHKPSHIDPVGNRHIAGYGISVKTPIFDRWQLTLGYKEAQTTTSKTLPFLTKPYVVDEVVSYLILENGKNNQKSYHPMIFLGHSIRHSDNKLQARQGLQLSIGLSFDIGS